MIKVTQIVWIRKHFATSITHFTRRGDKTLSIQVQSSLPCHLSQPFYLRSKPKTTTGTDREPTIHKDFPSNTKLTFLFGWYIFYVGSMPALVNNHIYWIVQKSLSILSKFRHGSFLLQFRHLSDGRNKRNDYLFNQIGA